MQRLISRAELSKRVRVNRSFVYKECNEGGALYAAMVGQKVNLEHPAAYAFCHKYDYQEPDQVEVALAATKEQKEKEKQKRIAQQRAEVAPRMDTLPPDAKDNDDHDAEEWLNMPLREIIARFGTQAQFKEYVAAAKNLVHMRGQEEDQARKRKEYIHRVHAERLVVMVDGMTKSLLSDAATNIATTVEAQVKAGAEKTEIERTLRETISRTIKGSKAQLERSLRSV